MELQELTVKSFTELLGSDAPAPGGGSAAALSGAQGAALSAMVCALTLGRKKYADFEENARQALTRANEHREHFLTLMQADTDAYNRYREVMALPKDSPERETVRRIWLDAASIACTLVPLKVMYEAVETLKLTKSLLGRTNKNAVSDLGVAALSLKAALCGAWLNVKINLPGLPQKMKKGSPEAFRIEGETLLKQGCSLADEITDAVERAL